jgi:signal transduction histidine kinase
MTLRFIQPFGGRLAVLALWLGTACLPSAAMAQNRSLRGFSMDDGLANPRTSTLDGDRDDEVVEDHDAVQAEPAPATRGYRILSLSNGEKGDLYLGDSDSGVLRLRADEQERLPPVSVDDGPFHFEVSPPIHEPESSGSTADDSPGHRPRARLTKVHVFHPTSGGVAEAASPARNGLTLSFTGIDLAAPATRFRYRLTGLDPGWMETARHSAYYPNLQPGAYFFEVLALNDAGLWSEPARLSITLQAPPWWSRNPELAIVFAVIGLALLTAGLYAAARMRRLLQMERLRASIAADLHDQVGAGLTDIAILSEVAARKAGDLPELSRVAATARELVDGMGDIVWLVNPRQDSLYELFLRLKDSYAELFVHAGAQLEVGDLSPFERARLPMTYRKDLHLLFKEALCNALRHSGCRQAELSVSLRRRRLEVELRDDGRGFDPERRNGHGEGLETMRRRAGRLGGRLSIDSSAAGTVVRFAGSIR